MKFSDLVVQIFTDIDQEEMKNETLRYYKKLGIIQPAQKEENRYRSFSIYDLETLLWIDHFKRPKDVLSLDQIDMSRDGITHLNIIDFLLGEADLIIS